MTETYSLVIAAAGLWVNACCGDVPATSEFTLSVEGEYSSVVVFPRTGVESREKRAFSVLTDGKYWQIRTTPLDAPTARTTEYYEAGFDGEYIYELTKLTGHLPEIDEVSALAQRMGIPITPPKGVILDNNRPPSKRMNQAVGLVYPDLMPAASPTHFLPLWLAYASGSYFATNHTATARQIWEDGKPFWASTNLIQASWKLTQTHPPFLRELNYYLTPRKDWPPPYSDDRGSELRPGVAYTVASFTNISGMYVPLQFTLVRYREDDIYNRAAILRVLTQVDATATRIVVHPDSRSKQTFKPAAEFPTRVADLRLENRGVGDAGEVYMITNRVWPSIEDLAKIKSVRIARLASPTSRDAAERSGTSWRTKRAVIIGFVLMSVCVLALSLRFFTTSTTQPKANKKGQL